MIVGILIGAVLMYVALYIFGRYIKAKAARITSAAVLKHMPYGDLIITDDVTVEEVFYCLLDLIQQDSTNGKLRFENIVEKNDETAA
jgi:hypothetical protein